MSDKRITELSSIVWDDLADDDQFTVVDVSDTTMDPTGTNKRVPKSQMQAGIDAAVAAHTGDASAAHAASAISYNGAAGLSATDVEAALDELDTEKASTGSVTTVSDGLAAHIADAADAHDASAISVLDTAGNFTGTDVEAVLAELPGRFATPVSVRRSGGPANWRVQTLAPRGTQFGIERVSTTSLFLWAELGGGYWWRQTLSQVSGVPGPHQTLYEISASIVVRPMMPYDDDDLSVTYVGTWATENNASHFGGSSRWSATTNDSATITVPAGATAVALKTSQPNFGGLSVVSINGDRQRANLLPTAQSLVDAGTFPNTILTSFGGTLDPDDRVYEHYNAGTRLGQTIPLADDLDPSISYTVSLICAGYRRAASTTNRVYFDGLSVAFAGTNLATAGVEQTPIVTLTASTGAQSYANEVRPNGTGTYTFLGNGHGYDNQTALTFTLDGTTVDPTVGQRLLGSRLVVTRTSQLFHPDTVPAVADVTMTMTVDANGVWYRVETTWLAAMQVRTAYGAMMNADGMQRANVNDGPAWTLATSGSAYLGQRRGRVLTAWQRPGRWAAAIYVPDTDLSVAGWANTSRFMGSVQTKLYAGRNETPNITVAAAGERWTYEFAQLVNGVDREADTYFGVEAMLGGVFEAHMPASTPLTVKGAPSQTAALQTWLSSADATLASVDSAGVVRGANFHLGTKRAVRDDGLSLGLGEGFQTVNLRPQAAGVKGILLFSGGSTAALAGGDQVIYIANATTVPSSNPTGGGILYVNNGALVYRGSSGTITTIAPA